MMHHVNKREVGTLPPGSSVFPIYSEFFNVGTEKTGESHPGRTPANSALEANQELNPQQLRSF